MKSTGEGTSSLLKADHIVSPWKKQCIIFKQGGHFKR